MLVDQVPAEARAVDEEVPGDGAVLLRIERRDESSLVALHADHVVDEAFDAATQPDFAQVAAEQHGVAVIGVVEQPFVLFALGGLRRPQLVGDEGRRTGQVAVIQIDLVVGREARPDVDEPHAIDLGYRFERMIVVMAPGLRGILAPIHELDAVLERGVSPDHELPLVDLEKAQRAFEIVERGFADADDPDVLGLHERHAGVRHLHAREQPLDVAGAHPTGRSAAHDHDSLDDAAHTPPVVSGPSQSHPVIA